jgi:SAM-dependent methyltransferase
MKRLKTYQKFFESVGSPLLDLSNNVDHHLISVIQKETKTPSKVLEISCGNGSDSLNLQELGYEVSCTEYNTDYVKHAKDLGLDCIQHDTKKKFPFSNNEFDLIYSRLGLHYFTEEELLSIFSELRRIGKGILITVKVVDDIKTGKVILTEDKWKEIVSRFFNIKSFKVKEGQLYGSQSKWIEILGEKSSEMFESISNEIEKKVIMNMFVCDRYSSYWAQSVDILRTIDFPTSVGTSGVSHKGLGKQVLLDINLEESKQFAEKLLTMFPETPLIVLAEVDIRMEDHEHIGYWYQDCLIEPGRWFDELLRKGKRGLFIHDKSMPKVVKEKFQVFESVDSDLEDIKDIMNDISDIENVVVDVEEVDRKLSFRDELVKDYQIRIYPEKGNHFKINQNIKQTIQRFNIQFKNEYSILYQYIDLYKQGWIKFYVYNDERGLRDYNSVKMDGSGKFQAPLISKILIKIIKNS